MQAMNNDINSAYSAVTGLNHHFDAKSFLMSDRPEFDPTAQTTQKESSLCKHQSTHLNFFAYSMVILLFLLALLTILTLFFYGQKPFFASRKLPPHPRGLPVLGNLLQIGGPMPHQSLDSLSKKHGPLILLHLGGGVPTVVVSSAEIAEQIMKGQDLIFASRPSSRMANRLLYNGKDIAFSPYCDYWRKVKKISIVHLLSIKQVKSFGLVRKEEVGLLIAELRASSQLNVNLSERLLNLTNDIICRVAFGRKFSKERRFGEIMDELGKLLGAFSMADFVPWIGGWIDVMTGLDKRAKRNSNQLDEFLEEVLEMHRVASKNPKFTNGGEEDATDFVDVLLSLKERQETSDTTISLQTDHIKALILDMFAGGTDTTFSTIEWSMAELVKNPTSMQKVQREIRDLIGSKGVVEEKDIKKMTYLNAVIKESLRLHVPVALLVPRVATRDTKLQGYDIPAGTRIIINAWAIARDPKYWDKPEHFWPERFINSDIDFRGQHFQFTPFGAGRRACPGMGFAIAAIEYTLANLLYHFDWEIPENKVLDMSESYGITVHLKSALTLTVKLHYPEI